MGMTKQKNPVLSYEIPESTQEDAAVESNLQKYLAFVKTAECRSFTLAAKRLGYTQSAVSRMIQDLEKDWNVSLLDRDKAGVRLTSDGLKLLPSVKSVCEEYKKLQMQVDDLNGLQSGMIRIGTFSSVANHWLPNIIKHFQADFPNIEFELLLGDYTELETWLLEGRIDCSFVILPVDPALETTVLEESPLLAVLPEDHPLAALEKVPLAELSREPFILMEKGKKAEIAEIFDRNRITPNVRFTTWDDYAIMSMVESGLGVSILPRLVLRRVPYRVAVRELDVPAMRKIGFSVKSRERASLAVKRFMDYLQYR